jgi:hypothetical protein
MIQGIGQDSSRARRFEVEVSTIPIFGSVAFSSLRRVSFFGAI